MAVGCRAQHAAADRVRRWQHARAGPATRLLAGALKPLTIAALGLPCARALQQDRPGRCEGGGGGAQAAAVAAGGAALTAPVHARRSRSPLRQCSHRQAAEEQAGEPHWCCCWWLLLLHLHLLQGRALWLVPSRTSGPGFNAETPR